MISTKAIEERVRRALKKNDLILRKSRPRKGFTELGDYYVVDFNNCIIEKNCDLETLAKKLGVIN